MNKQQLLEFIEKKGNQRKVKAHENVVFQTNDWANTNGLLNALAQQKTGILAQERAAFINMRSQNEQEKVVEQQAVEEIKNKTANKKRELEAERASG